MERSIAKEICAWYEKSKDKSGELLILCGAPLVGKTWVVNELCAMKNILKVDSTYIDNVLNAIDKIDEKISNRLIVFDDINDDVKLKRAQRTIVGLKEALKERCPNIVIISRIIKDDMYREVLGEKATIMHMYPMNFIEFQNAVSAIFRQEIFDLFKLYIVVGGLPGLVKSFISEGNLTKIRREQRRIVEKNLYNIDSVDKHFYGKCRNVIEIVARQDVNRNFFALRSISVNARDREYREVIDYLISIGVIYRIERLNRDNKKTDINVTCKYKLAFYDIGLYSMQAGFDEREIYNDFNLLSDKLVWNLLITEIISYGARKEWAISYWEKVRAKAKIPIVLSKERNVINDENGCNSKEFIPITYRRKNERPIKSICAFEDEYEVRKSLCFRTFKNEYLKRILYKEAKNKVEETGIYNIYAVFRDFV